MSKEPPGTPPPPLPPLLASGLEARVCVFVCVCVCVCFARAQSRGPMLTTLFQVTAGTVAGVAGIVAGQPFDTVKVRLQTSVPGTYSGPLDCVKKTL